MNHSLAVFLITDEVRGIRVSYDPTQRKDDKSVTYFFKSFDKSIVVGDYVAVPTDTRHGITVVKVEEVDVEPDFDTNFDFKWIIGIVDKKPYEDTLRKETAAVSAIKVAEKQDQRRKLREKMLLSEEAVKTLEITLSSATVGEEAKPEPSQGNGV